LAAVALLLSSLSLGGCATSTAGSSPMDARAEATAPPKASALSRGRRSAAPAREARDDGRRTVEAPEGIDRRARSPDVSC